MAEEIIQRNGIMVLLDIVGFTEELRRVGDKAAVELLIDLRKYIKAIG
jgi:hypothetical protein